MSLKISFAHQLNEGRWLETANASAANAAHFVLHATDAPACHALATGYPEVLRAKGPWAEAKEWRHLCGFCRGFVAQRLACGCGKCTAKRASDMAIKQRRGE